MTSNGMGNTGQADGVDHIITGYADQIKAFPIDQLDIFAYCQMYNREGTDGNSQEVVYVNYGNGDPQELAEGSEPQISHQDLLKATILVKKFGERAAITEEMIEDSRFDEMNLALTAVGQKMINGYVNKFFVELKAGPYGATDVPAAFMNKTWANAAAHLYSADHAGTPVAQSAAGHIYNTGSATLYLGDITLAMRHVEEHGFTPDTMLISEGLLQKVRDLAGFTKDIVPSTIVEELARLGRLAGKLEGMDVVVIKGGRLADNQFIVTAKSAKPVGYLTKRRLRVDTHDKENGRVGWDARGVTLSARYGFETLWQGATVVVTVST